MKAGCVVTRAHAVENIMISLQDPRDESNTNMYRLLPPGPGAQATVDGQESGCIWTPRGTSGSV